VRPTVVQRSAIESLSEKVRARAVHCAPPRLTRMVTCRYSPPCQSTSATACGCALSGSEDESSQRPVESAALQAFTAASAYSAGTSAGNTSMLTTRGTEVAGSYHVAPDASPTSSVHRRFFIDQGAPVRGPRGTYG
jgi:hypothetical protein